MPAADLIIYNGQIHTMVGEEVVSALASAEGRVLAVGTTEEILSLDNAQTHKIDLQGACVVPGFNDSHCHLRLTGEGEARLDLRGVRSREEIITRGRDYLRTHDLAPGTWVVGYGFDHNLFPDQALPDGATAQAISTAVPVLLDRVCGHVGAANTAALQAAGYDESTAIPGGILDRAPDGTLTGVLREAALDQIKMVVPKPDVTTVMDQLQTVMALLNRLGVTSAQTDDLEGTDLGTVLAAYHRLEQEGRMTVRVFEEVQAARIPELNTFLSMGLRTGTGSEWFQIGNIKLLTDGSLGARTAWLRSDYSDDPGNAGVPVYTQQDLDAVVLTAHQAGMQIAFHAIGDGAVEACVTAVERAQAQAPIPLRHRIVHCQFADKVLFRQMAEADILADVQPPFTASDYPLVRSRMGQDREAGAYAWKTMLQLGVHLAGGSDSPVETPDPLWGIYCAVTRQDGNGLPSEGWRPEERLTVQEAVALYTSAGAYHSFEEGEKGILQPGTMTDLVVLSQDIFSIPPEEIRNTQVTRTIVGGKTCYQRRP